MNLEKIRELSASYPGGIKKLASDIGMSEANFHRCINNCKMQAGDLEKVAIKLKVDIGTFFDEQAKKSASHVYQKGATSGSELIELCKELVANYQQRDLVMKELILRLKKY